MKNKIPILGVSKIHGVGVFTRFPIKKGEFVLIWDVKDSKKVSKNKLKPELKFFYDRYCVESKNYL